jgi:uncharacterized SAM-binding protein YcdF (DUF218 family)
MFFILSKLLHFLIAPLTWIVLLFCFYIFSKNEKNKMKYLITAIAFIFFFSNSFILDEFMRKWEIPAVSIADLPQAQYEAAIVLGGMSFYDGKLHRIQFTRSADRLFQAIDLYKSGKIKRIIFVGGSGSILHSEEKEAFFVKEYLQKIQFPDSALLIESESKNTHENAVFVKPILPFSKARYLLVTSAAHMRRSLACFKKEGIATYPYSTDRYSGPRKFEFDHLLIPNIGALQEWTVLIHEMVGYITYKIEGYI